MSLRTCHILTYRLYEGDATSRHTFELARVVAALGFAPVLFSHYPLGELPADIRPLARRVDYAGYAAHAHPDGRAPDLTLLQYPLWFPLAERFRAAGGARVFWYHGVTPPQMWPTADGRDLLETAQVRTDLAHFAHLAVAASPFTAAELQRHTGYSGDRLRVVPLGVDTQRFAAAPDAAHLTALRRQWRLEGARVLLYVGRIAGNKGIDLLIEAFSLLAPGRPDLRLLIVGDTQDGVVTQELTAALRRQAAGYGLAHRVIFTGRVADVAPFYRLANVYMHASRHEGFGVPLVEAMAAGVPVVSGADGALPWLLGGESAPDEAAGLLFPSGRAEELARHVARLLEEPELHAEMAARGRRRAPSFDVAAFRVRAASVLCEALELAKHAPAPTQAPSALAKDADIVLRDFGVSPRLPLMGRREVALRTAATEHLKEAYFDRIVERQVNFNRSLAAALDALAREARLLQANTDAAYGAGHGTEQS